MNIEPIETPSVLLPGKHFVKVGEKWLPVSREGTDIHVAWGLVWWRATDVIALGCPVGIKKEPCPSSIRIADSLDKKNQG